MNKIKEFFAKVFADAKAMTTVQKVVAVVAAVAVVAGGVAVVHTLGGSRGVDGTESTQENLKNPGPVVEETQQTESTEMEVTEVMNISITTTSIEKDLKIKIVDENKNLVAGQPFVVVVTPVGETDGTEYSDDDMDGIIYIKSIASGDYTVELQEIEGFLVTENPITANVKDQIAYEKIEDIENEAKDESEIDVSVEDTAQNDVEVEAEIQDTVALLEGNTTTTAVSKDVVDFSNFPVASVGSANTQTLQKTELVTAGTQAQNTDDSVGDVTGNSENESTESSTGTSGNRSGEGGTGSTETETVVHASVNASLPSSAKLYLAGSEASKNCDVNLTFSGLTGVSNVSELVTDVQWSIGDSNVATMIVNADGYGVKLSAKAAGSTTLTASITYVSGVNGESQTAQFTCNVTVGNQTDTSVQLKDTEGKLLYTDDKATTIATVADYATASEFYKDPKHTGWRSLDGYMYYFGPDNKPVTGTQVIGSVTYEFHEDGTLKESDQMVGIDVSRWQGNIDWKAVADAGIDFAIIRCGYRGSSTGVLVEDSYFRQNIKGATENGIKVGVYFFTQAITEAEAVEEASYALSLVEGYRLNFPVFIDTEWGSGGRANDLDKATRTAIIKAFCQTVRNSGYKPGVYASRNWYYNYLDDSQLSTYNIWVAQYNTSCNYKGRYDMWQYTSTGKVPGISGDVDMNICYTKY